MAIYEVVLNSTYYGQKCVNRWNYVSVTTPTSVFGSVALAFAFGFTDPTLGTKIMGNIRTMSATTVNFISYNIKNLYNPLDFYASPFTAGLVGTLGGNGLSPINAYGFIASQTRLDVGHGYKRFVGVVEEEVNAGGGISGSLISGQLTPLATKMTASLTYIDEGSPVLFQPAILAREKYTTPRGKDAYRKYPTEEEQIDHTATGIVWSPYSNSRGQQSRQYGRGA